MTQPNETLHERDIVTRRGTPLFTKTHGVVIHTFSITERDADSLRTAPVHAGQYAVVSWRHRTRLRAEPAANLVKVGVAEGP
jgi:hypothetical protein